MLRRIFGMIKFCIKKNWQYFVAIFLSLFIFSSGFFLAWKIQGHKIERYETIIINVGILLVWWEGKIEKLEKEKEEKEKEEKKQKRYNELIWIE